MSITGLLNTHWSNIQPGSIVRVIGSTADPDAQAALDGMIREHKHLRFAIHDSPSVQPPLAPVFLLVDTDMLFRWTDDRLSGVLTTIREAAQGAPNPAEDVRLVLVSQAMFDQRPDGSVRSWQGVRDVVNRHPGWNLPQIFNLIAPHSPFNQTIIAGPS